LQRLLTTIVLVGLLVATAAAFAVTERLKLTKSPITDTRVFPKAGFSPTCGCNRGKVSIRVKLRHADDLDVRILDASDDEVRSLVSGLHVGRGVSVFRWDGRTNGNVLAADGAYQAEIHLANQHRTIVLPNVIRLDTKAPEIVNVMVNREVFSPDGDAQSDFVRVKYTLSKPAHVNLYLGGKRILRTKQHGTSGSFSWFGHGVAGKLPPGSYGLQIGAVDSAGNGTPLAKRARIRVRLRYIALATKRIVVRGGTRFSIGVSTDAKRYTWRLGNRKSFATGPVLRVLASTRRGRYTLTVAERGHLARATVLVK
jgi:hypothetical protein